MSQDGDDSKASVRAFGHASLRLVPGQGWVFVPHLYRVTLHSVDGRRGSYEVQTFQGPTKAVAIATAVHGTPGDGSTVDEVRVDELGPTQAGGSPTAYDDRSEW